MNNYIMISIYFYFRFIAFKLRFNFKVISLQNIGKMKVTRVYRFFSTHSKICIIGGGTGGINLSTHLLRAKIPPSSIRIIEPADYHYYQPGWTMLGGNLCDADLTLRPMGDVISKTITWTKQRVANVNADKNEIVCENGEKITYDQIIFSSGLRMNWDKIKGAKQALENPGAPVGSIYELPFAQKTAKIGQNFKGGKAIFTEPPMPIKCAGAPQKILYLWTDKWRKAKLPAQIEFYKSVGVMFGVPKYSESLVKVAANYGIKTTFKHNLVEVRKDNVAIFENLDTKQKVQRKFDFLHLIPPMSAHSYIAESGLADGAGYLDVDKFTLQHKKHKNVWGLGDCSNTPNSKTAAAVFSQTETLVKYSINIKASMNNPDAQLPSKYEGYASCPLFVGDGKLMLAEFKYDGIVDETFFNNQEKPRKMFFYLKKYGFPHIYWHLVPRGLWGGRRGIKIDI